MTPDRTAALEVVVEAAREMSDPRNWQEIGVGPDGHPTWRYIGDTSKMGEALARLDSLPAADTEGEGGWRHKKRGTTYDIIGSATVQASLPPPLYDGAEVLIYRCREDGLLWVRRPTEFHDGRFEKIAPPSRGEPT